jgi:chitinase
LYFAFASINPSTYQITPSNPADTTLMTEFTALKSSTLETWIAIGGFDFSDVGSTHTTWSDLCADPTKRATFISSVQSYMETYGFQGVDIDWEYPVAPDRGGSPGDTTNFVSLIQEMRAAFGTSYGISITLAPDYWYLRYFDAISMEPYVDWFGFMAYDLHGSWDANIPALGALVRGQADIREIYNDTLPLFYDGLTPSKINMGIALYGRGYTLSDPSCNTLGCGFTGPSMPAPCTNTPGVMSLAEIQSFISLNGVQPTLLSDAMMKQITWADQWIGYDDADTIAMKKQFANNLCFGGTMAWSVDFNSGEGDGSQSPVSTDGSCGSVNGGTVCTGSGFGDCCSASGWCGSTDAYCGSGCQGNACIVGGLTTDGRCGVGNNGATCDGWASGTCCSASGWCGSTDAYCGAGNQPVYNAGNDGSSGAGGSTGGDNGSSGAGGSTGGASSSGSAGGSSTVSAGSSSTSSTQGSSTAVPPRCLLPSGADSGTIVETDTNRCMTQGPGEW